MKKKWLHNFKINRKVDKKQTEKKKDDKGEEVEVTKTVKEDIPAEFFLKKPNRKLYDDAELFYGVKMSEGIKAGLLTRNLLAKRYEDDGGAFSESEKERYSELYSEIYAKESEYQRLQLNLDNKPQELKEQISGEIISDLADLRRELVEIENSQANIFDQTAENRAKNQTIMWWVLQLAHWKEYDHENVKNFFGGKTYEERLDSYDEYEDSDDDFLNEAIRKLAFFTSFWYMGRATSDEEFKAVEELYDEQNKVDEDSEDTEDVKEVDEKGTEKKTKAKKKAKKQKTVAKKATKGKSRAEALKETVVAQKAVEESKSEESESEEKDLVASPTAETDKALTSQATETLTTETEENE